MLCFINDVFVTLSVIHIQGSAWHGKAWLGKARLGKAWRGKGLNKK